MLNNAADSLDGICRRLFPEGEPGAAVLILKGDKIIFDRSYGIADMTDKSPISGDSLFNIASVSKQFTATAILQLAERGELSLDNSVAEYHPEYRADFWDRIKLRHLLSHSSGVPDGRSYLSLHQRIYCDEELSMEFMAGLDHLNFEPGTYYEYINPTYVLLGDIVEKVSGKPFTDYVRNNIFEAAGMSRTFYFSPGIQLPDMTHGYEYDATPEQWKKFEYGEESFFATRPDGGIYTSVHEFTKWEMAIRDGLVLGSFEEAHAPHILVSGSPFCDYQNRPGTWYGYGWFIEPEKNCIYHTGDNGGYKILACRYPLSNALVLVFSNRSDWKRNSLKLKIEDLFEL